MAGNTELIWQVIRNAESGLLPIDDASFGSALPSVGSALPLVGSALPSVGFPNGSIRKKIGNPNSIRRLNK
jgi:hypothetical protein